jgi:hypothetical protein
MAGNPLANATAVASISRTIADRLLKEFLIRVGTVNGNPSWPCRVRKVVVFGSHLNNEERVGDIDLAIQLDRRPEIAKSWAVVLQLP